MSPATDTQRALRSLNLIMLLPLVALGGVLVVAFDADSWWEAVVLGAGVLAGLVAFERWTAGDLTRVALPCLLVGAAVWAFGVLVADSSSSIFALIVVGPLVIPRLHAHRGLAAFGLLIFVAGVGSSRLLNTQGDVRADLISYVIVPAGITAVIVGLMFPNKRFYDVVTDLEESRERDAELAVVRERIRFAGDLHDIQGHTLHVVKLKIALAHKLLHSDTARVEQELSEVYTLVADTITQTRELAYAQRRLNVVAELENAKNLFEAAGIRVKITRDTADHSPNNELLGQVLRETTTNILRHTRAADVRITLTAQGISIVNDGVPDDGMPRLRGLATLRHRVNEAGGELTVRIENGRFLTAATFDRPASLPPVTTPDDAR